MNPFQNWQSQCFGSYATDSVGRRILFDGVMQSPQSGTLPQAANWCALGWLAHEKVPPDVQRAFEHRLLITTGSSIVVNNDVQKRPPAWFAERWVDLMEGEAGRLWALEETDLG